MTGGVGVTRRSALLSFSEGDRMKTYRHKVLSLVLLTVAGCSIASCGGSQKKSNEGGQTLQEYEANTPPADDPCYGQHGEPLECQTNADCCKGMVCTKDPDRSQILRYCEQG
jgi:hypothetical protein